MENIATIMDTQKALETSFTQRFLELDAKIKLVSPHSHPTISSLSKEVGSFKEQVSAMLQLLRSQILAISESVDTMEMRHRRKHLLFSGIPEVADEDITVSVVNICQDSLHLPNVRQDSICLCHRLGSQVSDRPRPVLVRFHNIQLRDEVWTRKTALKGTSVVISEFLTRQRQTVFLAARKHFGMRRVWTRDGNTYIKLLNGRKERLSTIEQLQVLTSKHAPIPAHVVPTKKTESSSGPVASSTPTPPTTLPSSKPAAASTSAPAPTKTANVPTKTAPAPAASAGTAPPPLGKGDDSGASKKTEDRRGKRTN